MLDLKKNKQTQMLVIFATFVFLMVMDHLSSRGLSSIMHWIPLPTHRDKFYLLEFVFKSLELVLALIVGIWLPVRKFFKINFGKKTIIWLIVLAILTILISCIHPHNIFDGLFVGLIAAIPEEYIFRGIFLGALLTALAKTKYGVWTSLIVSSGLFSFYHIGNIFHQNLVATVTQMVAVLGMGFLFGALYVRTASLLIPMIVHFFIDYNLTIIQGLPDGYVAKDLNVGMVVITLFQLVLYITLGMISMNIVRPERWRLPKLLH
ncbi:CPBP family intramembrane glutamic endopeptidase [Convivina praedatoris]|uniref:CAAX prenyl protease 2/Lysostaphin resistance protein A-like domain-containing protein n=1 Tax=Convivina praedatoris TaxID=2880963 RepID=A0ABN8HF34_9LACO|nr:CPBP family intramembrane glutamic endopeptidase [Convivina sp. LMG 32447]CAH1855937.1 hypothetical protein R077815_01321 [Convivina sp. LMG 32447]CAH1856538.1 hypothetical protein LMG032447_01309 [Convivina sp. LMG 32447]CAH1856944.1 hypothetical protein R078138_01474 [Convivina sp. LMG 32447]